MPQAAPVAYVPDASGSRLQSAGPRCRMKLVSASVALPGGSHAHGHGEHMDHDEHSPDHQAHDAGASHDDARGDGSSGRTTCRGESHDDAGQHPLETGRPSARRQNHGNQLAVASGTGWKSSSSDGPGPPMTHSMRRGPLRGARQERDRRGQPDVERHGAGHYRPARQHFLEVTNPGRWMAPHREHHESGMMFTFDVVPG